MCRRLCPGRRAHLIVNVDRALKHWMIATEKGYENSLKKIKCIYSNGHATKDDCYSVALQVYEEYLNKVKSNQGMKRLHLTKCTSIIEKGGT